MSGDRRCPRATAAAARSTARSRSRRLIGPAASTSDSHTVTTRVSSMKRLSTMRIVKHGLAIGFRHAERVDDLGADRVVRDLARRVDAREGTAPTRGRASPTRR
ncbi:hypothetical protein PINS_up022448, partial [Pythium insidiosum]